MSVTAIADIINPEVLADQIAAKFPDKMVFGNSNLVEVDSTFPLGSPGTTFTMPFWKRIGAFGSLTEGTAMVPSKIAASKEYATVQRAGAAYEVYDTAALVSKADPMSEISTQTGIQAARYIDNQLMLEAKKTPNAVDVSGTTTGLWDQNTLITSVVSKLGDNYAAMLAGGRVIMHSKVYQDLITTGAIQNQYQSGMNTLQTGLLASISGLPIDISDLVTTTVVSGVTYYTTYVVGPGSLALFYQRQVTVEFDRDILLRADVIAASVDFSAHLFGWDDVGAALAYEDAKSIHVVTIKSK